MVRDDARECPRGGAPSAVLVPDGERDPRAAGHTPFGASPGHAVRTIVSGMDTPDTDARRNPWWAVLLVYVFGGVLALVAGRMLPWQDQDRRDPEW